MSKNVKKSSKNARIVDISYTLYIMNNIDKIYR